LKLFGRIYLILCSLFIAQNLSGQTGNIYPALQPVAKWFAAWELVSKEIYGLDTTRPVEFVFFDEKLVYSTSGIAVPGGEVIEGPALFGKKTTWKKIAHLGKIILPDKQTVPLGLMSFASPLTGEGNNAFFVMPLPEFWKTAGVESKEIGLENLITGVFLHEFSHTQQMQNFGKKMTAYEQDKMFANVNFSDDIIQDYFGKDSVYTAMFREETELFFAASEFKRKSKVLSMAKVALLALNYRQQKYFTGEKEILKPIDNFFLTMEGAGQYTMYAWFIHPSGGNLSAKDALAGVRRGKKWWSQDEGLSLFLVLNRLSQTRQWAKLMFGNETVSVIDLINAELR
jgi:hypothetical protein